MAIENFQHVNDHPDISKLALRPVIFKNLFMQDKLQDKAHVIFKYTCYFQIARQSSRNFFKKVFLERQ